MFAVVKTGGKQYRVSAGDVIKVEKLAGEAGDSITLGDVLMVGEGESVTVGSPMVEGAAVTAEVLEQARADKIVIFKKKRRHNYRRKAGHRQDITVLRVTDVAGGGKKSAKAKAEPAPAQEAAPEAAADDTPAKEE
ncbi:MAG: 50S ribosomal protein L21 [Alphaproteobacteria bacterium]